MNLLLIPFCYGSTSSLRYHWILFLVLVFSSMHSTVEEIDSIGAAPKPDWVRPLSQNTAYCNRTWPQLELMIPVYLKHGRDFQRRYEFENYFLRSFLLYWPQRISNTTLNIIIDEEHIGTEEHKELVSTLLQVEDQFYNKYKITPNKPSLYYNRGSDRQQLLMFWADNYTNSEYVGFSDTDATLLTYIDREDLFENGKPVVNGRSGQWNPKDGGWQWMPGGTYRTLHLNETMRCMSYFPVIIKLSHLKDMREYISKIHNKSFNNVFHDVIQNGSYSQFSIMCTYLFNFKQDEYTWFVHSVTPTWDGIHPPPVYGQNGNMSVYTPQMHYPKPRISTHTRYRSPYYELKVWKYSDLYVQLLQQGFCISPPFPNQNALCHQMPINSSISAGYYDEFHRFEFADWTDPAINSLEILQQAFEDRMNRIINCTHEWIPEQLKQINIT